MQMSSQSDPVSKLKHFHILAINSNCDFDGKGHLFHEMIQNIFKVSIVSKGNSWLPLDEETQGHMRQDTGALSDLIDAPFHHHQSSDQQQQLLYFPFPIKT